VRADQPVERALHDRHLEGGALPGLRQHGGAEDERALAAVSAARLGELALEAGVPPGVLEPRARLRQGRRRAARGAPRRARDLVHRLDRHRQPHRARPQA
jgi:hypothetical protein